MSEKLFCNRMRIDVQAVVDGVADEQARERFAEHCRSCPACARAYRQLLAVRRAVRGLPRRDAGPAFDGALRGRLRALPRGEWFPRARRLAPVLGALGLLAIAFCCSRFIAPGTPPGPGPEAVGDSRDIYVNSVRQASYDPFVDRAGIDIDVGAAFTGVRTETD